MKTTTRIKRTIKENTLNVVVVVGICRMGDFLFLKRKSFLRFNLIFCGHKNPLYSSKDSL